MGTITNMKSRETESDGICGGMELFKWEPGRGPEMHHGIIFTGGPHEKKFLALIRENGSIIPFTAPNEVIAEKTLEHMAPSTLRNLFGIRGGSVRDFAIIELPKDTSVDIYCPKTQQTLPYKHIH